LQVQTVEENFGLTATQYDGLLRNDRGDEAHEKLSLHEVGKILNDRNRQPMQRLLLFYFLNGSLIEGSVYLDEALSLNAWLPAFRTAGSFGVVLTQWVQFILWLYERNELLTHTIIVLHTMISALLAELSSRNTEHQALSAIRGAFAFLARAVDEYVIAVSNISGTTGDRMRLIVEGDGRVEFYERELAPLLRRNGARIVRLAPYNSWELIVGFLQQHPAAFIALLAAASPSINIRYHLKTEVMYQSERRLVRGGIASGSLETGNAKPTRNITRRTAGLPSSVDNALPAEGEYGVGDVVNERLTAYRGGNLTADFQLGMSTVVVGKLWKIIKQFESIFSDDP
jgi:hypothetical protein